MRTKKQIAAGQRRSLKAMRERIVNMCGEWDGVDQYSINVLEEVIEKMEWASRMLTEDEE